MEKYLRGFHVEITKARAYFGLFLSSLIYLPVTILIYYFLFRYVIQNGGDFPMSLREVLTYYTVVLFIHATISHSMAEVYYVFRDINEGNLDLWLIRPVSYPWMRYFRSLGSVCLMVPAGLLFLLAVFFGRFRMGNILAFIGSVFLGFTLLFAVMFLLGSLTFWLKSVLTLRDIFWYVLSFFSGEILPLNLLPRGLRALADNPLASVYYLPNQVLSSPSPLPILLRQILYAGGLLALAGAVWKIGVKKYESQGG